MSFQTLRQSSIAEYLSLAEGVTKIDVLDWWVKNADKLQSWATAYKKIVLCQSSSAASERIFSLLKSSLILVITMDLALEDYIEVSCNQTFKLILSHF